MNDLAALLQIVGSIALITLPPIALGRLLGGDDGSTLADLFATPIDPPWPRGVQEEEPVRWHVEALPARRSAGGGAGVSPDRKTNRPAVGLGTETGRC